MELRIRDDHGFINVAFGEWLIPKIRIKLVSNISKYKNLVNWDEYLNTSETVDRLYKTQYRASDVVVFAANNLVCKGTDGEIVIQFNNTKFVPGFNRLQLETLLKTINYGTQDTKACPIFTDSLNYFAEDIDLYTRMYYML